MKLNCICNLIVRIYKLKVSKKELFIKSIHKHLKILKKPIRASALRALNLLVNANDAESGGSDESDVDFDL